MLNFTKCKQNFTKCHYVFSSDSTIYTEFMDSYFDILRENIKFYRNKKSISQAKLAEFCDCSNGMIGLIESGKAKPSLDMILKIAASLDINPADLFLRGASISAEKIKSELETSFLKNLQNIINNFGNS